MSKNPNLTLTTQPHETPVATAPPSKITATNLHHHIFSPWKNGLMNELIRATYDIVNTREAAAADLREAGVTARDMMYIYDITPWLDQRYHDILSGNDSFSNYRTETSPFWAGVRSTLTLPDGVYFLGCAPRGTLDDVHDGPFAIFAASSVTPTITIEVSDDIYKKRRDTRERYLKYIHGLARGCRVHLTGSTYTLHRLAHDHEDDLGSTVNEFRDTRHTSAPPGGDRISNQVESALVNIPPGNSAWTILKLLNKRDTNVYSYKELYGRDDLPGGNSRTRQLLTTLYQHNLAQKVPIRGTSHVELLPAGEHAYKRYHSEHGEQASLGWFEQ